MNFLKRIIAGIFFAVAVLFSILALIAITNSTVGTVILLAIFAIGFALVGVLIIQRSGGSKGNTQPRNVTAFCNVHHVEGLPIAEKTMCKVTATNGDLQVQGGGSVFNISSDQIRAAEVKTDTEIANIVHSSAAKGIVGGLLFGPIGLVVGARATNKVKKTNNYFLIINYLSSDNELKYLLFSAGAVSHQVMKVTFALRVSTRYVEPAVVQL